MSANDYLTDIDGPEFGTAKVAPNVVQLSDTPGGGQRRQAPLLGKTNPSATRFATWSTRGDEAIRALTDHEINVAIQTLDLGEPVPLGLVATEGYHHRSRRG